MYLSHHYLIDLVGGACLSVTVFYLTMPVAFKDSDEINWEGEGSEGYEMVGTAGRVDEEELDIDEEIRKLEESDGPRRAEDVEGASGQPGKGKKNVRWGENEVFKGESPRASSSD